MPPGVLQCPEAEQARPEQFLGLQPKAKLDPGMKAILVEVLIQTVSSEKLLVVTAELRELCLRVLTFFPYCSARFLQNRFTIASCAPSATCSTPLSCFPNKSDPRTAAPFRQLLGFPTTHTTAPPHRGLPQRHCLPRLDEGLSAGSQGLIPTAPAQAPLFQGRFRTKP